MINLVGMCTYALLSFFRRFDLSQEVTLSKFLALIPYLCFLLYEVLEAINRVFIGRKLVLNFPIAHDFTNIADKNLQFWEPVEITLVYDARNNII